MSEQVTNAGEPTVGKSGPPVRNISGETKSIGDTIRHNERGADGRWVPRVPTMVGPPQPAHTVPGVRSYQPDDNGAARRRGYFAWHGERAADLHDYIDHNLDVINLATGDASCVEHRGPADTFPWLFGGRA